MSEHFSGHNLEAGLLQRARSWRDVLPPLVMLQSLRVSGSPIYLTLSLATIIVLSGLNGARWDGEIHDPLRFVRSLPSLVPATLDNLGWMVVSALIAMIPIALTMRAGALYAAGRDSESLTANFKIVGRSAVTLLFVLLLPTACISGLLVPVAALAVLAHIPSIGLLLTEAFAVFVVPFAILIGLVAAGSVIAIPLAWASVTIEKRRDAFDALSRGYEYLYRRPIQTLLYLAISGGLAVLLGWIATAVAYAGAVIVGRLFALVSGDEPLPMVIRVVLSDLPLAVMMTTLWATLGAVYLLLRKDANQQEIEDIAVSEIDRRASALPTLQSKKATAAQTP